VYRLYSIIQSLRNSNIMRTLLLLLVAVVGYIEARPSSIGSPAFFSKRIIGGADATAGEFPYQLSLQRQGTTGAWTHSCGAVLLANTKALTVAHCVEAAQATILRVIAGLHQRSVLTGTITSNIASYTIHNEYNSADATFANDIATLTLIDPIAANGGTIQYARLPPNDLQNFAGDGCVISGWGRTTNSNVLPDTLQKAAIPVLAVPGCRAQFAAVAAITWEKQICGFDAEGLVGACTGDDGAPLSCAATGGTVVAGLSSWGLTGPLSNCLTTFPSVYSRTSSYLAWISAN